jgi:hypothetical protein
MTFVDGIQDRGISQQLPLGGEGTINGVLRQALGLEVIKITAGSSIWLMKTRDRALWRSWPLPTWKKRLQTAYVLVM